MNAQKFLFPLAIVAVSIVLFLTNLSHGTFLLGWDNVMPEFGLKLNFTRSLFAVWQSYRGLGHIDAMAHAANLTHPIYIGILSLFLPQNMLRFTFILLTHLVGGLGAYFLFARLTKNRIAGLIGGLFYMLNLGILQLYFAPLEVFAIHFAALPWLTIAIISALKKLTARTAALLLLTSFLFSAQAFVPTVFLSFAVLAGSLLLSFTFQKKTALTRRFKKVTIIGTLIIIGNLFWLLPYVIALPQTVSDIRQSRINTMSSSELFARNKARGDLTSVLSLKGFMLDTVEYDTKIGKNVDFMTAWRTHVDSPLYAVSYMGILMTVAIGLWQALKKKTYVSIAFVASAGVSFIALANNTFGIAQLNALVRLLSPTLSEAFRIPFTKFVTLFAFTLSFFLSLGVVFITDKLPQYRRFLLTILAIAIFCLGWPAFRGQFFSPLLKVSLPTEYQELFDYMKTKDPQATVALLPLHTFWNWQYYDFGARGSGFLWYGLPQPILLRAFDPWSGRNEQAFNELYHSMLNEDKALLGKVLEKYNLSYLLLDRHIINNLSSKPINYDRIERFLETVPGVSREKEFGKLTIYSTGKKSLLETAGKLGSASPFVRSYRDVNFDNYGHYKSEPQNNLIYPFANLYTETGPLAGPLISQQGNQWLINSNISSISSQSLILQIPSYYATETLIPVIAELNNGKLHVRTIYPTFIIDHSRYEVAAEEFDFAVGSSLKSKIVLNGTVPVTAGKIFYVKGNFPNILTLTGTTQIERILFDTRNIASNNIEIALAKRPTIFQVTLPKEALIQEQTNLLTQKKYLYTESVSLDARTKYRCPRSMGKITANNDGHLDFETLCETREIAYFIPELLHSNAYLIMITGQNKSGLPLRLSIDNPSESRQEYESQFTSDNRQFFVLPKTQEFFEGYGFHIISSSTGFEESHSIVDTIGVFPFPQSLLEGVTIFTKEPEMLVAKTQDYTQIKPFLYETSLPPNNTLIFNRAYSPYWQAYIVDDHSFLKRYLLFVFGEKIESHFPVDNWANGWDVPHNNSCYVIHDSCFIIIIFWPQYLEFTGLGLLVVSFILIFLKSYMGSSVSTLEVD